MCKQGQALLTTISELLSQLIKDVKMHTDHIEFVEHVNVVKYTSTAGRISRLKLVFRRNLLWFQLTTCNCDSMFSDFWNYSAVCSQSYTFK